MTAVVRHAPIEPQRDRDRRPRGTLVVGVAVLALGAATTAGCSGRMRALGHPDRWSQDQCIARYVVQHHEAPLSELRERGGTRADFQDRFPAAQIDPADQSPVSGLARFTLDGQPIAWFSAALDVLVFDGAAFAPLRRVDLATASTSPARVGRATPRVREALGDRGVVELLVFAGVLQSYGHLGADLCLTAEVAEGGRYHARFLAVHQWATQRRGETRYSAVVTIDEDGIVKASSDGGG